MALLLGAAELAARHWWETPELLSHGSSLEGTLLAPHPTRMWAPTPGPIDQFGVSTHIDAHRLRAVPRTDAPTTVVTLGDSSIFGHGVDDADTLHARLQASLSARSVTADVLCGGIPGYSTEQTLVVLEEEIWDMEPDLLVIGNLWSDNNVDLFVDRELMARLRAPGARLDYWLRGSSLWTLLNRADATGVKGFEGATTHQAVSWILDPEQRGLRRVPLNDYASNLDRILSQAAERGVGAVMLAPASMDRMRLNDQGTTYGPYLDAMARVAAHRGVRVVDAREALAPHAARVDELFVDTLHPSGEGNRLYGELLADQLTEAGWPQQRLLPDAAAAAFPHVLEDPWSEMGGPPTLGDQVSLLQKALSTVHSDKPTRAAELCDSLEDASLQQACVLGAAAGLARDHSDTAEALCASQPAAMSNACFLELAWSARDPAWCGRAGPLAFACWHQGFIETQPHDWLPEDSDLEQVALTTQDWLQRLKMPADAVSTWNPLFKHTFTARGPTGCGEPLPSELRPICERALQEWTDRALEQALSEGQFSCAGDLPEVLSGSAVPEVLSAVERWREQGRCGDRPGGPPR